MSGVLGNSGGKKGRSGRKSLRGELEDFNWHYIIWNGVQDVSALERKIETGRYSGRDAAALMLLKGNTAVIGKFMDKLMPDIRKQPNNTYNGFISEEEVEKALANLRNATLLCSP